MKEAVRMIPKIPLCCFSAFLHDPMLNGMFLMVLFSKEEDYGSLFYSPLSNGTTTEGAFL
jgi:hypothetical protein